MSDTPEPPIRASARPRVAIALVHHANQHLITDGYEDRAGITEIAEAYEDLLFLHERYAVPANLHLSGTLLEALAWHRPAFLRLLRRMAASGLLAPVGGTYAENVMTLFPAEFNRRQLDELLWLYEHLLGFPPARVRVCWVPERVWDTRLLAPVLASRELRNGGYRYVLLDDRLLFRTGSSYAGSPRAAFDAAGPYRTPLESDGPPRARARRAGDEVRGAYLIEGGEGLAVVPIAANLRYWIPPRAPTDTRLLEEAVLGLAEQTEEALLVYADDMEKTAGVGGWDEHGLDQYESFLQWLVRHAAVVRAVLLDDWLRRRPPGPARTIEPGTFFELAHLWRAGEDYRGWAEARPWLPYRRYLTASAKAVRAAERARADERLLALAEKHLLASTHETAWRDVLTPGDAPAHWTRAIASHARACLPIVDAARCFARDRGQPRAEARDIDADGVEEVILRNESLYAVLTPRYGGRLVYVFHRLDGEGVLVIGNPTDHWNWQEELNRYMDRPPNHPGALVDAACEHDSYRPVALRSGESSAFARLVNVDRASRLRRARKSFLLAAAAPALAVCYQLPEGVEELAVEACLSPDYYRLLSEGRRGLRPYGGDSWRGFRNGPAAVWLARIPGERTAWEARPNREVGHGINLRLRARTRHFHLLVGCGETDEERCRELAERARSAMHRATLLDPEAAIAAGGAS